MRMMIEECDNTSQEIMQTGNKVGETPVPHANMGCKRRFPDWMKFNYGWGDALLLSFMQRT
jgi:hypothetical protein